MIIEAILQLDKGLNAANVNKVFNLTLKSFLDRDHSNALYYMGNSRSGNSVIWIPENAMRDFQNIFYNPPLHLKALEKHSHCLHNELEGTSPQGVVRLGRNVREFFLSLIGPEPPLWLSDLCAALITVSAFFFIHFICVPQQSALENGGHYNQLAQAFHSNVTRLLAFLGDHFKVGKFSLTLPGFCLCVTRQNLEVKILRRKT